MNTAEVTTKSKCPEVLSTRPGELAPLVEKWIRLNPGVPPARLVQRGLKLALRELAGKRYSHLVEVV